MIENKLSKSLDFASLFAKRSQSQKIKEKIQKRSLKKAREILLKKITKDENISDLENVFKDIKVPIIANDFIREFPEGEHTPNKRMSKNDLNYFLYLDFS